MENNYKFDESKVDEINRILKALQLPEPVMPNPKNWIPFFSIIVLILSLAAIFMISSQFCIIKHNCNNLLILSALILLFALSLICLTLKAKGSNDAYLRAQYEKECNYFNHFRKSLFDRYINEEERAIKAAEEEKKKIEKEENEKKEKEDRKKVEAKVKLSC